MVFFVFCFGEKQEITNFVFSPFIELVIIYLFPLYCFSGNIDYKCLDPHPPILDFPVIEYEASNKESE